MFSFFGSKPCKRCEGKLAEVEDQLLELKAENQRLQRALDQARQQVRVSQAPPHLHLTSSERKVTYIASRNRTHFHRPNCVWMEKLSDKNLLEFSGHEEAVKAGYRPCKTCCA